ncbi:DUF4349 domain-containing protein [Agromyces sp. Marseille-P2726]|uniref:DUF4349 domain-containing protein n=1 Tax=Agromyces sp. Marseille-P2726 TaxID=2709132 RepID=UPI001570E06C|nr:DUF4349 domain-containing protein [Agromyces sp. Marseille-P2726]
MRRRLAPAAAAAALAALLLAGCTAGGSESDRMTGMDSSTGGAPEMHAPVEGGAEGGGEQQQADRSVITTGWVSISVHDPIASAEEAADVAERAGGRVDHRTENPGTDTQPASASLTLRIPSDELDVVVDELRSLGEVNSVTMNATDVTEQRQDLDARIAALTASTDRLRELLATATSIADLIAIESELTTRQSEVDSLTQQRDSLVDQIDFSTITVDFVTDDVAPDPTPDDFWSGVVAGWNALVAFARFVGTAFGVMLPWIGAALVAGAVVIGIVILATRGRRPRPDAATAPTPPNPQGGEPQA